MADELKPYSGSVRTEPTNQGLRPFTGTLRGAPPAQPTTPAAPTGPQARPVGPRRDRVAPAFDSPLPQPEEFADFLRGNDFRANRPREGFDIDLPMPSMSMYDDLGRGDEAVSRAEERYQMYATHPQASRGALGEIIYRGRVVPRPSSGLFKDPDPSFLETVRGVARNTAKNVTETVGALGDAAADKLGIGGVQFVNPDTGEFNPRIVSAEERRERGGLLSRIARDTAELDAGEGIIDNITLEGGQLIAGGVGGLKAADQALKLLPRALDSRFVRGLGKVLGFEIGAASAMSDEVETLLIGENAMFGGLQESVPILKGIDVPPEAPEYQQILGRRVNVMMDAMMLAKPAESVMKGAIWANGFVYSSLIAPILQIGSKSRQEDAIVREVLDKLTAVTSATTEEEIMAVRDTIAGLIKNNQDVFIRSEDEVMGDVRFATDTMTALERALQDNNTEEARRIIAQARAMRSGVLNSRGGAPQLTEQMGATGRAIEDATRRVEEGAGGSEAIEGARQGIVQSADNQMVPFQRNIDALGTALSDIETNIGLALRNDPTFGQKLNQLSRMTGIDIYSGRNQASQEIVSNVRLAFESMDATKNELYGAIDGGEVDPQGMISILAQLRPSQLDAAAGALPANSQFGALLDVFKKRMKEVTDEAGETSTRLETDEELLNRVTRWMDNNDLDFAKLYREIRPSVSSSAENLFSATAPEARAAGQVLRQFSNWIDNDALDYVAQTGDTDIVEAALEAKRYYVQEYAPFWRDGVLGEVANTYRATVGRTSNAMREEFGVEVQPLNFNAQTRQRLEGVLNDANREFGTQVVQLLARPEAGGNARLVTDYIIGDIVGDVGVKLRSGTPMDQVELNEIVSRLSNYGALITNNFPQEAQRISGFIDNLRAAKGNAEATRRSLDLAIGAAEEAKTRIYDQELGAFFQRQGVPFSNGYAVFEGLFNNRQSADTLEGLMRRARVENNPVIIEGMQAAYARFLRERFLGSGVQMGGDRPLSLARERASAEEVSNVLQYGDIVFEGRPAVMQATRDLLELAGFQTRSRQARAVASDSPTASRTAAVEASNRVITFTFGVLSRTGARIRAGATNIINTLSPDEQAFRILDAIYADPKYFSEVADRVMKQDRRLTPETRDMIFAFFVRSGIYNEEDRQDFLPAIAQAELDYRTARNQMREQMYELFQGPAP